MSQKTIEKVSASSIGRLTEPRSRANSLVRDLDTKRFPSFTPKMTVLRRLDGRPSVCGWRSSSGRLNSREFCSFLWWFGRSKHDRFNRLLGLEPEKSGTANLAPPEKVAGFNDMRSDFLRAATHVPPDHATSLTFKSPHLTGAISFLQFACMTTSY
jgi:hypothetical protein